MAWPRSVTSNCTKSATAYDISHVAQWINEPVVRLSLGSGFPARIVMINRLYADQHCGQTCKNSHPLHASRFTLHVSPSLPCIPCIPRFRLPAFSVFQQRWSATACASSRRRFRRRGNPKSPAPAIVGRAAGVLPPPAPDGSGGSGSLNRNPARTRGPPTDNNRRAAVHARSGRHSCGTVIPDRQT